MTQHEVTVGIDVGDRHSYLCLLDTESGEVLEESRIPTGPAAFERRFSGTEPARIAIEAGMHSPWISRLLKRLGHEVLVANARKLAVREHRRAGRETPRGPRRAMEAHTAAAPAGAGVKDITAWVGSS